MMSTIQFKAIAVSIFLAGTLPLTGWADGLRCGGIFISSSFPVKNFAQKKDLLTESLREEAERIALEYKLPQNIVAIKDAKDVPAMWSTIFDVLGPTFLRVLYKTDGMHSAFSSAPLILMDSVRRETFREFLEAYLNHHMKEAPAGYHNLTQLQTAQFLDILVRKESFGEFMSLVEYVVAKTDLPDLAPDSIGEVIRKINSHRDNYPLPGQIPRKITLPTGEL